MPHESLRDAGVHGIHRHVVAVVGRPAECELREVARADDYASGLVGYVHKNLCPFSCLGVLVSHIVHRLVVADVQEMAVTGCGN